MEQEISAASSSDSYIPTRGTRRKIVYATLTFCAFLISYIIYSGSPENSLHVSALSWAFTTSLAVIGAYVFGAVFDNNNVLKNVKKV